MLKRRYLYTLLCLLPGALFSLIAATYVAGVSAGFFWLFLFGDDRWPETSGKVLMLLFWLTFLGLWLAALIFGFVTGKRLEANPALNKKHLLASVALTLLPLLIIVLHQTGVGKKHDSTICSDYCRDRGYSASGMPPRDSGDDSCLCYDGTGNEIIKVPMTSIRP